MTSARICGGDWVRCKTTESAPGNYGFVLRSAADGSWADVRWSDGVRSWTKRMRREALVIETTITLRDGSTAADLTRARELLLANHPHSPETCNGCRDMEDAALRPAITKESFDEQLRRHGIDPEKWP